MKAHSAYRQAGKVEAFRIVLALPGREKTLHTYKRPVDLDLATKKAAQLASLLMPSWHWASDLPAIEEDGSDDMILILGDSVKGAEAVCSL